MPAPLTEWNWAPSILIGLALLAGGYLGAAYLWRPRFRPSEPLPRAQVVWFMAGLGVIFVALLSPLDGLGDEYLFSAHMLQHFLIAFVAPPLLLLGTPAWLVRPLAAQTLIGRGLRFLTTPLIAFASFNLVFMAWHFPLLYEATLHDETIHIFEHLLFMATGVLNWWPILSPLPEMPRLSYPAQLAYLFLEGIPATILSALIVFAPAVLYPTYAAAERVIDLSPRDDQLFAGLIMWIPCDLLYLLALSLVFRAWFKREQTAQAAIA
jgi:cytochrome c oxidase assembly factor CtaG